MEARHKPLPPLGLVYTGPVVEPLGRLVLDIVNRPLLTYGLWEETLLALRIFVETWQTVEFSFEVGLDTTTGGISSIGFGRLVAINNPPTSRPPSEPE